MVHSNAHIVLFSIKEKGEIKNMMTKFKAITNVPLNLSKL